MIKIIIDDFDSNVLKIPIKSSTSVHFISLPLSIIQFWIQKSMSNKNLEQKDMFRASAFFYSTRIFLYKFRKVLL